MRTLVIAALVAMLAAAVALRPHAVERWGLYLGSPQSPDAHLFLDPFPSEATCETRVKVFAANAERAFCRSRREFEFGGAADATLAADFDPFSPASWFCLPRRNANVAVAVTPLRGVRASASR